MTASAVFLKLAGTLSANRRLSGAVYRCRFSLYARFQEHDSVSDAHQWHITVPANFKVAVMAVARYEPWEYSYVSVSQV